jgi:hypothetical protein
MRYAFILFTLIIGGASFHQHVFNSSDSHQTRYESTARVGEPNQGSLVGYTPFDQQGSLETVTDSTQSAEQMSFKEKMDSHIVHFTGAVMSDGFVLSHFSRAFVPDQYSDFIKPGKYSNGNLMLPKSIASSLDGIAIPPKTRLVVYNKQHLTGTVIMDITGPAIVNNGIWESSSFYAVANKKNFTADLQKIFPQRVRSFHGGSSSNMSYWPEFSFEIMEVE